MEQGDDELPDLLATNLRGSFELLVLRYASQLHVFALRWIGNPTDAEDIVQVAFERAFITLDNYPVPIIRALKLRPWLYKVTLNVSRNYVSRSKLHTVSLESLEDGDLPEQDEDWHSQPELVVESSERRRELEALVVREIDAAGRLQRRGQLLGFVLLLRFRQFHLRT